MNDSNSQFERSSGPRGEASLEDVVEPERAVMVARVMGTRLPSHSQPNELSTSQGLPPHQGYQTSQGLPPHQTSQGLPSHQGYRDIAGFATASDFAGTFFFPSHQGYQNVAGFATASDFAGTAFSSGIQLGTAGW